MVTKTVELEKQLFESGKISKKLSNLLMVVDGFSQFHYDKQIIITSLLRYSNKNSVHYWGRGADIRSWIYTTKEIKTLITFVNSNFPYSKMGLNSAIYHDVGQGIHIHLQVG